MEVHNRTCIAKEEETVFTKDLKLPDCFVWIPTLKVPIGTKWKRVGIENVRDSEQIPEVEEEDEELSSEFDGN